MFPDDLRYTSKHEWLRLGTSETARVGITSFAADALSDVVYVSLPQVGEEVSIDDACAELESTKSVADVYAPVSGVVSAVNDVVVNSPETVNADPYGDGWLFEVELSDPSQTESMMDADEYAAFTAE